MGKRQPGGRKPETPATHQHGEHHHEWLCIAGGHAVQLPRTILLKITAWLRTKLFPWRATFDQSLKAARHFSFSQRLAPCALLTFLTNLAWFPKKSQASFANSRFIQQNSATCNPAQALNLFGVSSFDLKIILFTML
jgi:hypothetical protein